MWACSIFDAFCSLRALVSPRISNAWGKLWAILSSQVRTFLQRSAKPIAAPQGEAVREISRWNHPHSSGDPWNIMKSSWNHPMTSGGFIMFCHVLSQVDSISEVVHPFGSVSFAPGFRILPRLFGTSRGLPEESKNLSQSTRWAGKMDPHMHSVYL